MKTVAYSSPFVPPEWIAAHGLQPRRVLPARATGGLPQGVCPFAQAFMEDLAQHEYAAAVLTTTCDQMRRAPENQIAPPRCPMFLMNVPATQSQNAKQLYLDELRRLGEFLVEQGGTAPSHEHLSSIMRQYDLARHELRNREQQLTARGLVESLFSVGSSNGLCLRQSSIVNRQSAICLALVGGPLTEEDLALLDLVEDHGGRVVLNATECGTRTLPASFDPEAMRRSPLAELARAYFDVIPDAFRRPDDLLYEYLRRELAGRDVQGIVLVRQVWCDLWHAQAQRVRGELGLPLLDLDISCGGAAGASLATRVGAFLEALR